MATALRNARKLFGTLWAFRPQELITKASSCGTRLSVISGGKKRCFHANAMSIPSEEARIKNWEARVQLAAAHRILERLNLHEGVCNHLTLIAPAANGEGEVMLLKSHGVHWSQVTASSLIGLNRNGEVIEGKGKAEISAVTIHTPLHINRPDAACIMHVHPPYSTALGLLKDFRLPRTHQNFIRFIDETTIDETYDGLSYAMSEGERLASILKDKSLMFMKNHGILVAQPNVAMAFDDIYYLERACMFHTIALSTGKELCEMSEEMFRKQKEVHGGNMQEYANDHFFAMIHILEKDCPDFKD